jgi:excisionase family DNA binding protein
MQVQGTRLYRVRDVAEHFDVSVNTIYRAIESGQLTALKLGTGTGTFRVTVLRSLRMRRRALRPPTSVGSPVAGPPTRPRTRRRPVTSQRWGWLGDGRVAGESGAAAVGAGG